MVTKNKIKFWTDSQQVSSALVLGIEENTILLDGEHSFSGSVMASFNVRHMSYYFKADLEGSALKLIGKVYRSERRSDMRFNVAYMSSSYIYFDIEDEQVAQADNVLHFNKAKNNEESFIRDFSSSLDDFPELRGAKLVDISSHGASFVMGLQDFKTFTNRKLSMGTIVLEKNSFEIKNIEKIYDIDYVNFRLDNIPMKKIGVHFENNDGLKSQLDELDDKSIILTSLDEEFNTYINQQPEE